MYSVGGELYDSSVVADGHTLPLVLFHTPESPQSGMTWAVAVELAVLQGHCAELATDVHALQPAVGSPVAVVVEEQVIAVVWQDDWRHYYATELDHGDCQPADHHILKCKMEYADDCTYLIAMRYEDMILPGTLFLQTGIIEQLC